IRPQLVVFSGTNSAAAIAPSRPILELALLLGPRCKVSSQACVKLEILVIVGCWPFLTTKQLFSYSPRRARLLIAIRRKCWLFGNSVSANGS
ncbi:hypothetical protein LINGRAHAP2_LOCUS34484, partial [Linum grandiflorum]